MGGGPSRPERRDTDTGGNEAEEIAAGEELKREEEGCDGGGSGRRSGKGRASGCYERTVLPAPPDLRSPERTRAGMAHWEQRRVTQRTMNLSDEPHMPRTPREACNEEMRKHCEAEHASTRHSRSAERAAATPCAGGDTEKVTGAEAEEGKREEEMEESEEEARSRWIPLEGGQMNLPLHQWQHQKAQ